MDQMGKMADISKWQWLFGRYQRQSRSESVDQHQAPELLR